MSNASKMHHPINTAQNIDKNTYLCKSEQFVSKKKLESRNKECLLYLNIKW